MHRRALLASLVSSLLVGIAGCQSDPGETGSSSPTDNATRTNSPATGTTQRPPSTGTPTGDAYTVPDADRILGSAQAKLRNDSGEATTLTLAVEYEGDRFFEESFDLKAGDEVSTDSLVASHATYDVVVETSDGGRATDEWSIPERWHWPQLAILVADDGSLQIGCGLPRSREIPVENTDETPRDVTLTLSDGNETVVETTQTIQPGNGHLSFDGPIGGEYEMQIETDEGSDTATYLSCYCRNTEARVQIDDGKPTLETLRLTCE
ncbi:hypothetical protein ELS19_09125 [Halogeometricum borinquense]|uniref:Ig-like domain-containing protein n=1 Tax=Halogeometricum borinquense TaxID=60847 RepID=A0A482TFV9_9EURY|nr:hypothetical protein [Halogeometricum borinquense]RYJ14108.1 hypothetical protein ELS19_09125 [Halogeometricum borinquense]